MSRQYMTNAINTSPTRTGIAGADIDISGGKVVKFNENGEIVLCDTKGEKPIGIITIDNDAIIGKGDTVSYQIFGVGVAAIGEEVACGAELTTGTNGKLVAAAANDFVCAVALDNFSADSIGTVETVNYYKV